MVTVKVSTRGQISLPGEARSRLGIKAGDRLTVQVVDDMLVLRIRSEKPSERLAGIGRHIWDGVDRSSESARCGTNGMTSFTSEPGPLTAFAV